MTMRWGCVWCGASGVVEYQLTDTVESLLASVVMQHELASPACNWIYHGQLQLTILDLHGEVSLLRGSTTSPPKVLTTTPQRLVPRLSVTERSDDRTPD